MVYLWPTEAIEKNFTPLRKLSHSILISYAILKMYFILTVSLIITALLIFKICKGEAKALNLGWLFKQEFPRKSEYIMVKVHLRCRPLLRLCI